MVRSKRRNFVRHQVFQTALASLTESIDRYGDEGIKERTSHYPHLSDLLQRIKERRIFIDTERTVGREHIAEKLSALNDIVRLCSAISPEKVLWLGFLTLFASKHRF